MVELGLIPQVLYHKVWAFNPENVEDALVNIEEKGLIPRVPSEYAMSLPESLRYTSAVWLAGRMINPDGKTVSVRTLGLDCSRLFRLDWVDVDWWLYQGVIPPSAIEVQFPNFSKAKRR